MIRLTRFDTLETEHAQQKSNTKTAEPYFILQILPFNTNYYTKLVRQ
jgi:hypothetical protein